MKLIVLIITSLFTLTTSKPISDGNLILNGTFVGTLNRTTSIAAATAMNVADDTNWDLEYDISPGVKNTKCNAVKPATITFKEMGAANVFSLTSDAWRVGQLLGNTNTKTKVDLIWGCGAVPDDLGKDDSKVKIIFVFNRYPEIWGTQQWVDNDGWFQACSVRVKHAPSDLDVVFRNTYAWVDDSVWKWFRI